MELLRTLIIKLGSRDSMAIYISTTPEKKDLSIPSHRLYIFCKKPQHAGIKYHSKIPEDIIYIGKFFSKIEIQT